LLKYVEITMSLMKNENEHFLKLTNSLQDLKRESSHIILDQYQNL